MKIKLFFLLLTSFAFAQSGRNIANKIIELQKENKDFVSYTLFSKNENFQNLEYKKTTENGTILTLNLEKVNDIVSNKNEFLSLEIPYQNKNINVLLYKVDVQTKDFQLDTDKNQNVVVEKGVHYRGIIKDNFSSLVSFNFFKNQMTAIISDPENSNLVLGKLEIQNNTKDYIIYSDATMKIPHNFQCTTKDEVNIASLPEKSEKTAMTNKCVTMYFEMDHNLFLANGSSVVQSNVWMNSVFNNVQTLYDNDGINISLNSVFVWTTQDPYNGTSSFQNLTLFQQTRPLFNGDLGQLVGIDGGFGGVAFLNGICVDYNYSYSDVFFNFNTVPTYSWTVEVIAHELGHLMGSPHTHGCYWNGNNTAIDGCGPTASATYAEGSCDIGPVPSSQVKGTIMSYCHLVSGVGINFANGFGPQPAARMIQIVNAGTCLSTDCIATCITQITNIKALSITTNSATISWSDLNTSNTSWQVSVTTFPFIVSTWTTVTTNNFAVSGLLPNTYYSFSIRPICTASQTPRRKSLIFATSDNFCAGRPFTDTGGANNSYKDNENWVRTVAPLNSNNKVKVVFNAINIETDYDYLYVYNGLDTNAPELIANGITGTTLVGPFESTHSSGALTFKFISDTNTVASGWNGNFSCTTLGVNELDFVDFSYYPNPVKNNITITSKNEIQNIAIYSLDGKLLYQDNSKQFDAVIDLTNYAIGTYVFKLQFENKPITFKVIRN